MRTFDGILTALTALALLAPAASSGQDLPEPGTRVQVTRGDGWVILGELTWASADSLRVVDGAETVHTMPLTAVEGMRRSLGRHRKFARNFLVTAGVAAIGAGALGAVTWSPCESTAFMGCLMHPGSRGEAFEWGMAVGGIIGVPAGLIVGATRRYEEWVEVDLGGPERASVSIEPLLGPRPGIVVTLRPGGP